MDGGNLESCPDQALELTPGEHVFFGEVEGVGTVERTEAVIGMTTVYVDLVLDRPIQQTIAPTPTRSDQSVSVISVVGWGAAGIGGGLMLAGVIYDQAVISPLIEDFNEAKETFDSSRASGLKDAIETDQTINAGILVVGATLISVGTGLLLYEYLSEDEVQTSVMVAPNGAVLSVQF